MEQPLAQGPGNTPDAPRANPSTVRGIAVCAGLGGLFLVIHAILMALKPPGIVGGSYREAGPADLILFLAGVGLIIATAVGLFWMHRFDGRGARVVRIAALAAAASWLIAVLGMVITAVFFQGDSSLIYYLAVFPGFVLALLASAVVGAGLMRSRVLPAWSGAMLIVASLLMFAMNSEDARVLFFIPFGVTWMVLGGLLWSTAASSSSRWHARIQHA